MSLYRPHVFWITGLAGAGKTTVARLLVDCLKESGESVVLLDGDSLREVFDAKEAFDADSRLALAKRYAKLCASLNAQGHHVVCATISMFDEVRAWNRKHFSHYIEVFLDVPQATLHERDQKGLYSGQHDHVVGESLKLELPKYPDLVIRNHGDITPKQACDKIIQAYQERLQSDGTEYGSRSDNLVSQG